MVTTLDINIFKVIDAGHFWARPLAQPEFMGKLNDHFRNSTTSDIFKPLSKGQICVVRRSSDKLWYRARVINVLQTLSGPQASVYLVDLAESTLIPCSRVREVPAEFQNIPFQAMECFLTGLKPLALVTAYFDLTTAKQESDHWDEAATSLFKTLIQGCKLQVTIQNQDEKGQYHVLLMADNGLSQVCINDELVISGFATYFSDTVNTSSMNPVKAAKLQAINEKFQKQGSEVIKNLKEYISHGKFTSSEHSNSSDEELVNRARYNHLSVTPGESPLNVLRRHMSGSYGVKNGDLSEPSARIPTRVSQVAASVPSAHNGYSNGFENESMYRRTDALSGDENSGRVRFLSSRLPATGSGSVRGCSSIPSKSPAGSSNLKPILKKRSPHGAAQHSSGSSSEVEDMYLRKHKQWDDEDSGLSRSEISELANGSEGISLMEKRTKELSATSNAISVDALFSDLRQTSGDAVLSQRAKPFMQNNIEPFREENSQQRVSSVMEPLRSAVEKHRHGQLPDSGSTMSAIQPLPQNSVPESYDLAPPQYSFKKEHQMVMNNSSPTSTAKPLLPSEMLLSKSQSSTSQPASGKTILFVNGVLIQTEGAPAPKAVFSLEHSLFAPYLCKLNLSSPSLIQAHAWPAIARGRDVVGVCSANEEAALAYLVPIIHQLVEERALYADLPSSSGPKLLILVPTWHRGENISFLCKEMLARNRDIRVQLIFAGGAEESQVIQMINGCEILIAPPPCFLRILRKGYVNMNRLCHTVFNDADVMVESFTSEIKDIMRHYAKLLKSQPDRLAPRQAVVMASSWSPGVASLVKAYLGNPVLIFSDMMEAAIYRNVQQIVTVCYDSQRDVPLLGYIESFISSKEDTKDICVFTSTTSEAETVEEILKANCYFTLVAHEFLQPQELASVKRQWNTPHSSDASPILVMTDGVIDQMNITNASCVIHYSIPTSKSKLCRRLTTMAGTFTSSEDHGCMSVIFVTDKCRPHLPAIFAQLVKRSGQEVPQSLQDMVAEITAQEAERKELCYNLKSFGTCRFKALNKHCKMRHTVSAILDKPSPGIPTSGIVKVLILSVESTSCYWVRILEHKPPDSQQAGSHTHSADSTDFLELTMSISGWFADPSHIVKQEQVSVGDLCALMTNGKPFQRVKICYISGREPHSNKPQRVGIRYVDKGDFEKDVDVDRLLQLPSHLRSCPFQAVEVFACRLQPLDKDSAWTAKANYFVKHLIEGKEMEGRVVLSLGNTMWLDPLVERHHLKNINVTTNLLNVRMELLKEKLAADNKQHVKLLRNLCEGVVDLSPLESGATGLAENSSEQCSALETVVLPEEGFHAVYVSAVRNPCLFFIQLKSSEDSLEDLEQRINSGVGTVDVEEGEISIGSLCVAKFSENDRWYRARVMGSRPDNEYDVFFVDFGDQEWVTADRIVPAWSSILQLPLQAIECSLVNVQPVENDWSDESINAFWEMVHELLLFAKVKSKGPSLINGSHKLEVELCDTSTEHDLIINQEMVAAGHARTSPEANKMLFPYSNGETQDYQFPYQRIPDMCLDVHQCRDPKQKVEIVKEIQTVVLNSESYKDDIRACGGVQGLCRLLSLNRDPFVLQHILTSLASLAFENEMNCEEIRNQGGLEVMCYLLGKFEDSAVQETLAWALQNVAATERNQNEVSKRGGIKALCALLKTVSDDRVQERVAWAIGSLVKDHTSNCQAVQDCGGLKTLCEVTGVTESENVLERAIWTLGMLATDVKNRNFIRQYGGIESICKRLQKSPSEQIIKQGALTLKTLAANNQFNKDVMSRLGMIATLRSFMTDELQKLGIISRRVCWDLLQRLLGSAADMFEGASPQAHFPVTKTQDTSSCPGSVQKQGPQIKMANGLGDSDDNEDLPPLGGEEDSDKENENALATTPTSSDNQSAKRSEKQSSSRQPKKNPSVGAIIQSRPITLEEENFVPFRVHPKTVWSQTRDLVRVCVKLRDVKREHAYTEITASRLKFRTQMGCTLYELDLELFEDIDPLHLDSRLNVRGSEVQINLRKINHAVWTRLIKSKEKLPYVSIDFDRWEVWSSSEEDEEDEGTRAAPTNLNSTRQDSDDNGETKQVLLPEMIVSDSSDSDDEASYSSGVDCFNFN